MWELRKPVAFALSEVRIQCQLSFPSRSEIDSELLDDKTEVLGVLAADDQGLCILSQGEVDPKLSNVASSLAKIGSQLELQSEEQPTIVLESSKK